MLNTPFWERKTLDEMSDAEWDALCDGCGQCCLHKLINEDTGEVFYTRVACRLLEAETVRCSRYATRLEEVNDCLDVRRMTAKEISWMPKTCAYRRLADGLPLPEWHPLLCDDPSAMIAAGVSVAGRVISEHQADLTDLEAEIIEWIEA